jgi:hypothetical protein
MFILDKRLNDKGKNWRHVHKALILLDFLLHAGSEATIAYAQENGPYIKTLLQFQYVDDAGLDRGIVVRTKAKAIIDLLDEGGQDRLRHDRASLDLDAFIHKRFAEYFKANSEYVPAGATSTSSSSTSAVDPIDRDMAQAIALSRAESSKNKNSSLHELEEQEERDLQRALELSCKDAELQACKRPTPQTNHLLDLYEGPVAFTEPQNYESQFNFTQYDDSASTAAYQSQQDNLLHNSHNANDQQALIPNTFPTDTLNRQSQALGYQNLNLVFEQQHAQIDEKHGISQVYGQMQDIFYAPQQHAAYWQPYGHQHMKPLSDQQHVLGCGSFVASGQTLSMPQDASLTFMHSIAQPNTAHWHHDMAANSNDPSAFFLNKANQMANQDPFAALAKEAILSTKSHSSKMLPIEAPPQTVPKQMTSSGWGTYDFDPLLQHPSSTLAMTASSKMLRPAFASSSPEELSAPKSSISIQQDQISFKHSASQTLNQYLSHPGASDPTANSNNHSYLHGMPTFPPN